MPRRRRRDDRLHSSPAFVRALGRTIKVTRTDLGVDRRSLAEEAGISYSYLTEIENGNKPPSSAVLGPIAGALGLRMSQLIQAAEHRAQAAEEDEGLRAAYEGLSASSPAAYEPAGDQAEYSQPLDRFELELRSAPARPYALRPSFRGANRSLRAALMELEALLPALASEDVERLLDLARRLAR